MISIIVAMDSNNGIGCNGELLTYLPGDLPRFKELTINKTVIMGRKTYDSLPKGPLPKRENIIISRSKDLHIDGAIVVNSLEEAVKISSKDIFIIGGGEIYKQALNIADKLYVTHIEKSFTADTFFPQIGREWEIYSEEVVNNNPELIFRYTNYKRVKK